MKIKTRRITTTGFIENFGHTVIKNIIQLLVKPITSLFGITLPF